MLPNKSAAELKKGGLSGRWGMLFELEFVELEDFVLERILLPVPEDPFKLRIGGCGKAAVPFPLPKRPLLEDK